MGMQSRIRLRKTTPRRESKANPASLKLRRDKSIKAEDGIQETEDTRLRLMTTPRQEKCKIYALGTKPILKITGKKEDSLGKCLSIGEILFL
jgi:hypothetical protein